MCTLKIKKRGEAFWAVEIIHQEWSVVVRFEKSEYGMNGLFATRKEARVRAKYLNKYNHVKRATVVRMMVLPE